MAERIKQRDAERSKEQILQAAEALFAREGFRAGVDRIAAKSRLNKRMIYHYFGNKAGLWRAVLTRQYEKVARVEADLSSKTSLADVTAELIGRYHEFLASDPHFVKILMQENLHDGRFVRKLPVARTKVPLLLALEKALRSGSATHLDPAQLLVDCLALCFFYFSNQATLSSLLGWDPLDRAHLARRIDHVRRIVRLVTSGDVPATSPANRPR